MWLVCRRKKKSNGQADQVENEGTNSGQQTVAQDNGCLAPIDTYIELTETENVYEDPDRVYEESYDVIGVPSVVVYNEADIVNNVR